MVSGGSELLVVEGVGGMCYACWVGSDFIGGGVDDGREGGFF